MADKYILVDRVPQACGDLYEWGEWMGSTDRRVGLDIVGRYRVSTVFLGLDHSFGGSEPVLFETMVFDDESKEPYSELYCRRHKTWTEAAAEHANTVEWVKRGMPGEREVF